MMGKAKRNKGFTMVELIVVIVIILVLAAVLVPSLLKYIRKAQEAAAIEECAGVVRMAAVERAQWLADGGTAPTKEEIVSSAGASGKIDLVKYNDDEFDVTYMRYICKNGIVVIYEYDKDPQYHIEGENESSPTTIIQNWIDDANDISKQIGNNNNSDYVDRQKIITDIYNKYNGLLEVDETYTKGTQYEKDKEPLYWRPYYIGKTRDPVTLLYANNDSDGSRKNWYAKIVYIDGSIYESTSGSGTSINKIYDGNKNLEDAKAWLLANGFKLVE